MEDTERKLQVLKAAVVKLTRQKAEADEKNAQLVEALDAERRRSAQLADDVAHVRIELARAQQQAAAASQQGGGGGSRWKFFQRGAATSVEDAHAQHAPQPAESTVLSDLILQNERLHEELFDTRTSLEKRSRDAEAHCKSLQEAVEAANAEIAALRELAPAASQESHSTSPTLPKSKSWTPAAADVTPPPQLTSLTLGHFCDSALHCVRLLDVAEDSHAAAVGFSLLLHTMASAAPSTKLAEGDQLALQLRELDTMISAQVTRLSKLWNGRSRIADCPAEISNVLRAMFLAIADNSSLLCRAINAVGNTTDAEARGAAQALHSLMLTMAASARTLNDSFVIEIDRDAALRWKVVENFCHVAKAGMVEQFPRVHTSLLEVVDRVGRVMSGAAAQDAQPSTLIDIAQDVQDILDAIDIRMPTRHHLSGTEQTASWSAAKGDDEAAAGDEAGSAATSSQTPLVLTAPAPLQAPAVNRWLRLADDQAVFWRRQFEIAMTELEERTAALESKTEEAVGLKASVAREIKEREWTTRALQTQIEVLSDQLANLASAS